MRRQVIEKLEVLADAAKYDVSCASGGSERKNLDLQRRHVPKRYWADMTEMRGPEA